LAGNPGFAPSSVFSDWNRGRRHRLDVLAAQSSALDMMKKMNRWDQTIEPSSDGKIHKGT
jgi:hypothetical protein